MRAVVALGRHPENDIVLDDRTLSRFHARLERRGDRYVVIDLGAQNGVYLNGSKITGECDLVPGDRIGMGRYVAIFEADAANPSRQRRGKRIDDYGPTSRGGDTVAGDERPSIEDDLAQQADSFDGRTGPTDPEEAFEGPTTAVERKADVPTLVLLYNGLEVSRHVVSSEADLVIGRSKGCDIVISLLGLSRRHATVSSDGSHAQVVDMGSQNGTWVNNARIEGSRRLRHGDLLNFYEYGLLFLEDPNVDIGFAGAGFEDASDAGDVLAGRETSHQGPPSVQTKPILAGKVGDNRGPTRRTAPLEDESEEAGGVAGALEDLGLGEGSILHDDFDDEFDNSLIGAEPVDGGEGTDILEGLDPNDEGDFHTQTKQTAPSMPRHEPKKGRSVDDTLRPGGGGVGWPDDDELEDALSHSASDMLASLEIYLGGKLYTQMPLSQQVTRIGSDPRCELALPARAKLQAWHVTLVNFGAATVCYRAARSADVTIAGNAVDQAVLRDGDSVELGRVRIVYRCR